MAIPKTERLYEMSAEEIQELLESPLPRGPKSLLTKALDSSWRVGVVSLAIRFNHAEVDGMKIPPFYAVWHYDTEGKKWFFDSARAANGQPLNARDCTAVLQEPLFLLPSDPHSESGNS